MIKIVFLLLASTFAFVQDIQHIYINGNHLEFNHKQVDNGSLKCIEISRHHWKILYGFRKKTFGVNTKGKIHLLSSEIYIEDKSSIRFLHSRPENSGERKLMENYIHKM